jgi:hypothetical protein
LALDSGGFEERNAAALVIKKCRIVLIACDVGCLWFSDTKIDVG